MLELGTKQNPEVGLQKPQDSRQKSHLHWIKSERKISTVKSQTVTMTSDSGSSVLFDPAACRESDYYKHTACDVLLLY